jgi:hypothetical protein
MVIYRQASFFILPFSNFTSIMKIEQLCVIQVQVNNTIGKMLIKYKLNSSVHMIKELFLYDDGVKQAQHVSR